MSISQGIEGTDTNRGDQFVDSTLKTNFEPQQTHLTAEQVLDYLIVAIQDITTDGTKTIAIIGGPASGKSTLVNALSSNLSQSGIKSDSISTDDYGLGTRAWRWERERDNPLSLKDFTLLNKHAQSIKKLKDGEVVTVPVYDEQTGLAIEVGPENFPHKVSKVDVLFVEGDFDALENPNLMVFVDVPTETRMQARIDRDLKKRGEVDAEKVANSFKSRHEKQFTPHTAPAITKADLVLRVSPIPGAWQYDIYKPKHENGSSLV